MAEALKTFIISYVEYGLRNNDSSIKFATIEDVDAQTAKETFMVRHPLAEVMSVELA